MPENKVVNPTTGRNNTNIGDLAKRLPPVMGRCKYPTDSDDTEQAMRPSAAKNVRAVRPTFWTKPCICLGTVARRY